ncbi:MAG: SPOR domain-containing protein [Flavobacteriales bacterium]|nr:SPOR domain-containing protein [Flavobacteriales bacterium]
MRYTLVLWLLLFMPLQAFLQNVTAFHDVQPAGAAGSYSVKTTVSGLEGVDIARITYYIDNSHTYNPSPNNGLFSDRNDKYIKFYVMAVPPSGTLTVELGVTLSGTGEFVFPVEFQYSKNEEKTSVNFPRISLTHEPSMLAANEPATEEVKTEASSNASPEVEPETPAEMETEEPADNLEQKIKDEEAKNLAAEQAAQEEAQRQKEAETAAQQAAAEKAKQEKLAAEQAAQEEAQRQKEAETAAQQAAAEKAKQEKLAAEQAAQEEAQRQKEAEEAAQQAAEEKAKQEQLAAEQAAAQRQKEAEEAAQQASTTKTEGESNSSPFGNNTELTGGNGAASVNELEEETTNTSAKSTETPAPSPSSAKYSIQILSLSKFSQSRLDQYIREHNLDPSKVHKKDTGEWMKISYGELSSKDEAREMIQKLRRSHNITDGFLVTLP